MVLSPIIPCLEVLTTFQNVKNRCAPGVSWLRLASQNHKNHKLIEVVK